MRFTEWDAKGINLVCEQPGHERSPAQGLGGTRFGVHNPRSGGGKHDQPFPDELQDHEGGIAKCKEQCSTITQVII